MEKRKNKKKEREMKGKKGKKILKKNFQSAEIHSAVVDRI